MTSTAILSQFSTFSIQGSTAGAAKAITAITQGYPAVVTSAAHGFSKGDVVDLAAIVGMTQLNGVRAVVSYTTANSYALSGVNSTAYTAYASGGTATPVPWVPISNIKTYSAFDGAATNIDVSNLQSTAKEYLIGLKDLGQMTLSLDLDTTDAGQIALLDAQSTQLIKQFKLVLPNGKVATFAGFAKKVGADGGVDKQLSRAVDILISGDVTWT